MRFGPFGARDVGGFDDGARRGAARAHDEAGALVGNLVFLEPAVADRLLHRDMVPGGAAAEEPHRAAIDHFFGLQGRGAFDLAAEAELGVFFRARNAGAALAQAGQHFLRVVADRGDDPHAGDDDAPHPILLNVRVIGRIKSKRIAFKLRRPRLGGAEQADAHVLDLIYALAVGLQPAVGDAEHQLAPEDALDVDAINDAFDGGEHLIGEFHFADAERPAAARKGRASRGKTPSIARGRRARGSPASPDRP